MCFRLIKDKYYYNILNELNDKVPEFKSSFTEEDGIYPILGEFGRFIIENIANEPILKKSLQFINNAFEIGGNETEDAIVLQIFQPIYVNAHLVIIIKPWLQGNALKVFLEFKDK